LGDDFLPEWSRKQSDGIVLVQPLTMLPECPAEKQSKREERRDSYRLGEAMMRPFELQQMWHSVAFRMIIMAVEY